MIDFENQCESFFHCYKKLEFSTQCTIIKSQLLQLKPHLLLFHRFVPFWTALLSRWVCRLHSKPLFECFQTWQSHQFIHLMASSEELKKSKKLHASDVLFSHLTVIPCGKFEVREGGVWGGSKKWRLSPELSSYISLPELPTFIIWGAAPPRMRKTSFAKRSKMGPKIKKKDTRNALPFLAKEQTNK